MNRAEAIKSIVARHPTAAILFCNGLTSREASHTCERPGNFYLVHGMGEPLAIGIGLRLARPDLEVVVVDGDGNAIMGLASWTLLPVDGLYYYVLVNNTYETTGSQPTPSLTIDSPFVTKIQIDAGTIGAPVPPRPEQMTAQFASWLATISKR